MATSFATILVQLNKDNWMFTDEYCKHYRSIFSSEWPNVYGLMRSHRASDHEVQYNLLGKYLDFFKRQQPEKYMSLLKRIFEVCKEYTIVNRENRFSPFAATLLEQVRHLDNPAECNAFLQEIVDCIILCIAHKIEFHGAEERSFDDILEWQKGQKWSYRTILNDYMENALPNLLRFVVSTLRKTTDLKETTIETAIQNLLNDHSNRQLAARLELLDKYNAVQEEEGGKLSVKSAGVYEYGESIFFSDKLRRTSKEAMESVFTLLADEWESQATRHSIILDTIDGVVRIASGATLPEPVAALMGGYLDPIIPDSNAFTLAFRQFKDSQTSESAVTPSSFLPQEEKKTAAEAKKM